LLWLLLGIVAVLVVAGVMSLAWMLLLTLVVLAEKTLPQGRLTSAFVGFALITVGVAVAAGAISTF
jgi:predicted metal-binding membrane protein